MKLLAYTANHPSRKNLRVRYIEAVAKSLSEKYPVKIIWIVCQPKPIPSEESTDYSIHDIHEFSNSVDLLKKLKPDFVMVSVGIELIQYSLGISAKYLQIPLISFLSAKMIFQTLPSSNRVQQSFRRMISSNVSTDISDEGENFKRLRFFFYKLNFLFKTKLSIKMNPLKIISQTLKELPAQTGLRPLTPNVISNLYIAHHENQKSNIIKKSIPSEKIIVTGHPLLDIMHEKYKKQQINSKNISHPKILIVTDSLFEHGLWTSQQRDNFLTNLFSVLIEHDIDFSLKIHPASENKIYYEKLLRQLNTNSKIFQSEDLWDVISDYNMILSYGYSTSQTEISYAGMRMIMLFPGIELPKFPLVADGISSGHIQECKQIDDLPNQFEK